MNAIVEVEKPLLLRVGTVEVHGAKRFVANAKARKKAGIGWMNKEFKKVFSGRIEKDQLPAIVIAHRLEESLNDEQIIGQLGGFVEIRLADLFELMEAQKEGQTGILQTRGEANVAYVWDAKRIRWAVNFVWGAKHWNIFSYRDYVWRPHTQILSIKS